MNTDLCLLCKNYIYNIDDINSYTDFLKYNRISNVCIICLKLSLHTQCYSCNHIICNNCNKFYDNAPIKSKIIDIINFSKIYPNKHEIKKMLEPLNSDTQLRLNIFKKHSMPLYESDQDTGFDHMYDSFYHNKLSLHPRYPKTEITSFDINEYNTKIKYLNDYVEKLNDRIDFLESTMKSNVPCKENERIVDEYKKLLELYKEQYKSINKSTSSHEIVRDEMQYPFQPSYKASSSSRESFDHPIFKLLTPPANNSILQEKFNRVKKLIRDQDFVDIDIARVTNLHIQDTKEGSGHKYQQELVELLNKKNDMYPFVESHVNQYNSAVLEERIY